MSSSITRAVTSVLGESQVHQFQRDGYLVLRQLTDLETCQAMRSVIAESLQPLRAPVEFETDVNYPGSPPSRQAQGGETVRRLLHAYTRHPLFRDWATGSLLGRRLAQLLNTTSVMASQNHHNCIMTKHPGFSSSTHWHQDIRYWRFDRPELISAWLALGTERSNNGCLRVIPGSHTLNLDPGQFDAELFLREDLADNQKLLDTAIDVELNVGDVLLFHCKTLHFAGQNLSNETKYSLVFTFHSADNQAIPDTRSARFPSILVHTD